MSDEITLVGDYKLSDTPLVGAGYKLFTDGLSAGQDVAKGDMKAVAGDVSSIAGDTTGFASEAMTAASDPLNYLISKGLGFLESILWPLKWAIEQVTGDPDALKDSAKAFDEVAASLNKLAADVLRHANAGGAGWAGSAAPSAGRTIGETRDSIEASAEGAGHIARLLQISSMLMKAAYDIVNGIIADVIEYLVVTWIAAQAAAPFTFGASEGVAMAASVAEVSTGTAQAEGKIAQVTRIIRKVIEIVKKIMRILKESKLGKFASQAGKDLRESRAGRSMEQKFMRSQTREGDTVVQEAGAGGRAVAGDAQRTGLRDSAETVARGRGYDPENPDPKLRFDVSDADAFKQNVRDNIGQQIADSARNRALVEAGLPTKVPQGASEWVEAGTKFYDKANGYYDEGHTAYEYGDDPGAKSGHGTSEVPDGPSRNEQEMIDRYGFPQEDPDRAV